MRTSLNIILPNQLFEESSLLKNNDDFLLIEENLFFNQYKFHKQKILFHRLSMKFYQIYLESLGKKVKYLKSTDPYSDIIIFLEKNIALYSKIEIIDPDDNYIEKSIKRFSEKNKIELVIHENPTFLLSLIHI